MIELLVIAGLYTLRLLLKMQWMTTVIFGLYMLVRVRIYRKRFRQIKEQKLRFEEACEYMDTFATVYKGNIIKNLIMDCQSYTKYRPNETTGGIFVSWRRKEELPTGA